VTGSDRYPLSVAELALFGVTLEDRTGLSGADTLPDGPAELAEALVRAVDCSTGGMTRVYLLLSGGYDSRWLLAALMRLEKEVVCCSWDIANPSPEEDIAEELASVAGFPFRRIPAVSLGYDDLDGFLDGFVLRAEGRLPVTRLRTAAAVHGLDAGGAQCVVWGEGELIRPPVVPGEYLTAEVMEVLGGGVREGRPAGSFFAESLPWDEARKRLAERTGHLKGLPRTAGYASWLRDFSYPHIYGGLARAASGRLPVVMPFLDRSLSEAMLRRREHSISGRTDWKPSLRHMLADRRLYNRVLSDLAPGLLRVRTDRGYRPSSDASPLAPFFIAQASVSSYIRRRRGSGKADMALRRLVATRLSASLPSPLADNERVEAVLDDWAGWSPDRYLELARLLAVLLAGTEHGAHG
jgi:hypothetical protein